MSLVIDNRKKYSLGTRVGVIRSGLVCLLSGLSITGHFDVEPPEVSLEEMGHLVQGE